MKRGFASLLIVGLGLGGCMESGTPPSGVPGHGDALAVRASAIDIDHETLLTFQADWNTVTSNPPILAGGRLRVRYAPERLPYCRAVYNGYPAWSIVLEYQALPDPTVRSVTLGPDGGVLGALIDVPEAAQTLVLWFTNRDYQGCTASDSRYGENYTFAVAPPAEPTDVVFTSAWQEEAAGPLVQGGLLRVNYAPERLRACRATTHGGRMWNLFASWRFTPGGESGTVALYEGDYYAGESAILRPLVAIPANATGVDFWFSNSDALGCVAWDSAYGANYAFAVVPADAAHPPVGWAGDFDFVLAGHTERHLGNVDPAYYFDSWEGMPQASRVDVQVWVPGVTDQAYASADAARSAAASWIRAEVTSDALAGATPDVWGSRPLAFERQQGNNFVYSFALGPLRWDTVGLNVPDGLYRYELRFSTDGGTHWTKAGPADAPARRFVVAPNVDCALFPDAAPPECPQARVVGWAGNWGGYFTHACYHRAGLPEPVVFTKSALGHDCMALTAEVWVEGLTDREGNPGALTAEVVTNLGYGGGPLPAPVSYPLSYDGRVGNNYRYVWQVSQHVAMSERGDYTFQFRFSADGGRTFYTIGAGDGPGGGAPRTLAIRNDSSDVDPVQYCDDIELWEGASAHHGYCLDYVPQAQYDANFCEFYVNALGRGQWSHSGVTLAWLEAYVRVAPQQGDVENVGMWVRYHDLATDAAGERFSLGRQIEPNYWLTGFTSEHTGLSGGSFRLAVDAFAFFLDVRRPTGEVVRLWQSNGGANYTVAGAFAVPGYVKGIGAGSIEYADESVDLFDQKHACQQ